MTSADDSPGEAAALTLDSATTEREPSTPARRITVQIRNPITMCWVHWRPILLIALIIVAVGLALGLFFLQYSPDRKIDDAAADQVLRAASEGATAVLSYSSDTLDRDFADAKTHLTGGFLDYYNKFAAAVVAPVVRDKHLVQKAVVIRAAASHLRPTSAEVLIFVNETVVSADKKDPQITPAAVRLTLEKVNGTWLISKLDPIG